MLNITFNRSFVTKHIILYETSTFVKSVNDFLKPSFSYKTVFSASRYLTKQHYSNRKPLSKTKDI